MAFTAKLCRYLDEKFTEMFLKKFSISHIYFGQSGSHYQDGSYAHI